MDFNNFQKRLELLYIKFIVYIPYILLEIFSIRFKIGIINEIIEAAPTDGLWDDSRNDESQLGLTYGQIEEAMNNSNSKYYDKYLKIREPNLHKMKPIPVCIIPKD